MFWDICTLLGVKVDQRHYVFETYASFLHSTQLNGVLLAMILCAVSTNLYADTPCAATQKILDNVLMFFLFFFSSPSYLNSFQKHHGNIIMPKL